MTPLEKIKWASMIACDHRLSDSAVRVGIYLVSCLNSQTGQLNPSITTIHDAIGLSKRGIQYALNMLIESGWVKQNKLGNGRGKHAQYSLINGANSDSTKGAKSAPIKIVKGANNAPIKKQKGANFDTERVQNSTIKGAKFDNPPTPPYKEEYVKEPVKGISEGCNGGDKSLPVVRKKQGVTSSEKSAKPITSETWSAYANAYSRRYGVEPVRNASVNGQLANFVKRIGAEEAPRVAAFYVQSRNSYYTTCGHSVKAMLSDAEKLRTEWATGRQVTTTKARQADKAQSNFDAVSGAMKILEGRR